MPHPDPQQEIVTRLRDTARDAEDRLYRARLGLERARRDERRAREQRTVSPAAREEEIAALRSQWADHERTMAALGDELRALDVWLVAQQNQRRSLEHLQRNLAAAERRREALRRELEELRRRSPTDQRIPALEAELAQIGRTLDELQATIRERQAEDDRRRDEERRKRERRDGVAAALERERDATRRVQDRLTEMLRPAPHDVERAEEERRGLEAGMTRLAGDLASTRENLRGAIADLYRVDPHPRGRLGRVDDRTPFLLLPVRLETIFVPIDASRTELWVRVYPDEIAVHTHEKELTDAEVTAGEQYWTALVVASYLRTERDARRGAAWKHLVAVYGGHRAAWIARQTRPTDWDAHVAAGTTDTLIDFLGVADPGLLPKLRAQLSSDTRAAFDGTIASKDGDALAGLADEHGWFPLINAATASRIAGFPTHAVTKSDAWTRTPRTEVLPDRFVLLLTPAGGGTPREVVGNPIADTVWLGPDPLDAGSGFVSSDRQVKFGASFEWMSDFGKAEAQGLGFRIPLSEIEARDGFDRILAIGLLLSTTADEGAALLEALVANHQYGGKGFSLIPQGTPTNNTEREGSGYSDNDVYEDLAFYTGDEPPGFDAADPDPKKSRTDGRLLADALGISHSALATVRHADRTDALDAAAMSTALFPATLGYWLQTWMSPVIPVERAREARSFFIRFVSGRGPLAAVRVGDQPYGVLLTSDFSRWKYPGDDGLFLLLPGADAERRFLRDLYRLLAELQSIWNRRLPQLSFIGKPGSDPSQVLMDILGLHPLSVEFFQRLGYGDDYLRELDQFKTTGRYGGELASLQRSMPATARLYFEDHGFETETKSIAAMRAAHVLWQHYVTSLDVPNLIENRPPSESRTLTHNYIDWLSKASAVQQIRDGYPAASAQSALLYLMLRNALLLQLHRGSYEWLRERTDFEPALEQSLAATSIAGVRAAPQISKYELMATPVQVAEPGHVSPTLPVADWVWSGPPASEVEAAFAQDQRRALGHLAAATTAQLERAFVEHLDCCSHRLDAWQTGLFAQRLAAQRASAPRGLHLGAFGWIEHLTPAAKTFLDREHVPAMLRPPDSNPVLEEDQVVRGSADQQRASRGGFVHAPSLGHAAAAALLRNAYLSHATPDQADPFAINLTSERVRRAQFALDGMRNGQAIEALLGYQFERGLHDRSSASAASGAAIPLDLNRFILPFREVFPLEALDVAAAGSANPIETLPATNVVNGLKLSEAALASGNGYGLATVLSAPDLPDAAQGTAILAERDALLDTIDAVKDLLMAENAYQLVRGNFDRVAAVSLAQKDAHVPNEIEVINTPRGTEFTFTNRVTLQFEALDPASTSSNPWPAAPMTPRARFEAGMNAWLGTVMGDPGEIALVAYVPGATPGVRVDERSITLADLGLQPVDFVWLLNLASESIGGATELETQVAWHYRRLVAASETQTVRILFNAPGPADKSFAQVFPLARHLRTLLSESRSLDATDFLPGATAKKQNSSPADDNPKGIDIADLRGRVTAALADLGSRADALDGVSAPSVTIAFPDETFVGALGDGFAKLESKQLTFADSDVAVTFALADAEDLHATLRGIAEFGFNDAFPPEADLVPAAARAALLARAHRVARRLRRKDPPGVLDRATALMAQATAEKTIERQAQLLVEAGRLIFAETFTLLPRFTYHNAGDLAAAAAARTQLLSHAVASTPGATEASIVDEWLIGLARVRPKLHRWELVRTLADAINDLTLPHVPAQVPYRAADSWLAVEFPEKDPLDPSKPFGLSRDTLSIAAHGSSAFAAAAAQSGILLDEWTEEIPTAQEITGIAFRFNQPNAVAPQAVLLVVTPEETGAWSWDAIVGAVTDTLERAKRRAVEPSHLETEGMIWNAVMPALVSEFSTIPDADISLDPMLMLQFSPLNDFYSARAARS